MLFNYNELPDWQNMAVLGRNLLSPRAFFVPYANEAEYGGNLSLNRSSRVLLLDGEWKFRFFPSAMEIKEEETGAGTEGYVSTEVPSCWQTYAFEKPCYVNVPFPFPAAPPLVPYENPCGVYKRKFFVEKQAKRTILSFLGVSSAYSVYLNGHFVGYGEGSHMTGEFDVTDCVRQGENDIAVFVYKWCNGSYLECQDMFRSNGIFRSVYLTFCEDVSLFDFHIETEVYKNRRAKLSLRAELFGRTEGVRLRAALSYGGVSAGEVFADAANVVHLSFEVEKPRLWSAETPELYDLSLTLLKDGRETEYVRQPVGFKDIEIKKGVFLFNGKKIKLFGVNHHDTHPERGYALTSEDMEKDVVLMKRHHINAVRFSHYPPHPFMLYLCDKYGLYAIDEADIESHGELHMKTGSGTFSRDKAWRSRFVDRIDRMYFRDRNRCSVTMWSLGNESGCGKNHEYVYNRLKKYCPHIPVHYEGGREYENTTSDVLSFMYASPEAMKNQSPASSRPLFLCEFAHSMGVGPGGMKEYMDLFLSDDKMLGGCVWEWAEHAALVDGKLTYGGDNGEGVHDGNFCVDGMMSPYREPTPSAREIAAAYRPVRAKLLLNGIRFTSVLRFRALDLKVRFTLNREGKKISAKEQSLHLAPDSEKVIPLPFRAEYPCDEFIDIEYFENGTLLGREQVCLNGEDSRFVPPDAPLPLLTERDGEYVFTCGDTQIIFDKISNTVRSIQAYGAEFLNQNPRINAYTVPDRKIAGFTYDLVRCGIDNDMYVKSVWAALGLYNVWNNVVSRKLKREDDCFVLTVNSILAPPKYDKLFDGKLEYRIYGNGVIKITAALIPARGDLFNLPKFGVKFEMPSGFDKAEYYGYGEGENYPDFLESSVIGKFCAKVDDLSYPYLKPQEGGNRSGVKRLRLIDRKKGVALKITAADCMLNFNATSYDTADFERVKHHYELEKKDTVNVLIDGFFGGIGSNSCGPLPFDAYRFDIDKEKSFSFTVQPERAEGEL